MLRIAIISLFGRRTISAMINILKSPVFHRGMDGCDYPGGWGFGLGFDKSAFGYPIYIGFVFAPNDYRIYHFINNGYYSEAVGSTETGRRMTC